MTPILHVSLCLAALGQPTADTPWLDSEQANRFVEFYKQEAAQYEMHVGDGDGTKLTLREDPVFRWADAQNTNFNGAIFVWTRDGRAEAMTAIWSFHIKTAQGQRRIAHTFQSLATGALEARRRGERAWYPSEGAIEPEPVPDSPEPAETAPRRLIQMRSLAQRFTVMDEVNGQWTELRLLPQPIYRYEQPASRTDGAVFAFLHNAEAEALLVIEERESPAGNSWHYGIAPFGNWPLSVRYDDAEVWSRGRERNATNPTNNHFSNYTATLTNWFLEERPESGDDR